MALPLIRRMATENHRRLLGTATQRPLLLWNRYASTAAAVEDQPAVSTHVILPNPSLQAFRYSSRVLPSNIAEQFAILNACIRSGDMARAERIMKELHRTKRDEMKVFADLHLYNSFLNGFAVATKPMAAECLVWADNMKLYGLCPDVNTYAIVIKAYLKTEQHAAVRALLREMHSDTPYAVQGLIKSDYLSKHDVGLFRNFIKITPESDMAEVPELLAQLEATIDAALPKASATATTPASATASPKVIFEATPVAIPTEAMGVQFLRDQLTALQDPTKVASMDPYELQLALEEQGYDVALQRLQHMKQESIDRGDTLTAMNLTPLKKTMWEWHQTTVPLILQEIERCDNATGRASIERKTYGPFLKLLKPETLSMITMLELLRLHNSSGIADGMKTARAVIDVGKAVEMEYNATQIKKVSSKRMARNQEVHSLFASGKLFNMAVRRAQASMMKQHNAKSQLIESSEGDTGVIGETGEWTPVWPSSIRAKVGSVLTSIFLDAAKIRVPSLNPETGEKMVEDIPAFFHTYQYVKGKRVGIIKVSEPLTKLLSREPVRDTLHPRLLPMIVHPRPWLSYNSGGYLSAKSSCMRIKDSPEQLVYLHKASEEDRMNAVLAGLDVLGSTQWRVNKKVFNVVLEAWNTGEEIADIPSAIKDHLPLPVKPENYDTDPKAKFQWMNKVKEIQTEEKNMHSLRCDVNYKVETARAFLNLPMYFPHNMDFRGRAYPIPPTLNHLGNDLCRGLLMFGEAKPLGERGWKWLKIHLANLYGYDKHSFTDREKFTVDNLPNILDSVDNPLTGNRWWLKADSPWQCLATCYEVAAAQRSGDPEHFMSQIPVHQDGTCNGLQHYAALGGDMAGAQAVNLAPGDRPADVYTGVAEMVNKVIEKEASEGVKEAEMLIGKISRKVVKQTVMTNVYGVTFVGARAQIESRLRERHDIPPEKVYALAGYLTRKVFASLGEMFNGARMIQDWLTDSARRIARSVPEEALQEAGILPKPDNSEGDGEASVTSTSSGNRKQKTKPFSARNPTSNQMTSVIWTTPLGLPIVQPYRRSGKKQVTTLLQTVFIEDPDASRPVNSLKQSTAFPPNFIHSLDATHMLMSAVACHERGLTFASVHDSYWTHACNVDEMNQVIREQFIELHSQPIMENLISEFCERYKNYKIPVTREIAKEDRRIIDEDAEALASFGFAKAPASITGGSSLDRSKEQRAMDALFGIEDTSTDEDAESVPEQVSETEKPKVNKRAGQRRYDHIWEDLTLLPLPEKGEFDINQVKNSAYFFH